MNYREFIKKYSDSQSFVQLLYRRLSHIGRVHGVKAAYVDHEARQIALAWQAILRADYNFSAADFSLLSEEIAGELVAQIAKRGNTLFKIQPQIDKNAADDSRKIAEFLPEYVGVDMGIQILFRGSRYNQEKYVTLPMQKLVLQFCESLRANAALGRSFARSLDLKPEWVPD